MSCDLDRIFGEMRGTLPKDPHSNYVFSKSSFKTWPARLETDQLVLMTSSHEYGTGYRADVVRFYGKREALQNLGLLILAVVFGEGGSRVHVALAHPRSTVKNLVVSYDGVTPRPSGHTSKPQHFSFSPEKVEKYPWKNWGSRYWPLSTYPSFTLTNMKEYLPDETAWASRDTVKGFGNDDASILLGSLLLNLGYSEQNEVVLEGEGGVRGVGINSAEAVFMVIEDIGAITA